MLLFERLFIPLFICCLALLEKSFYQNTDHDDYDDHDDHDDELFLQNG